MEKYQTSHAQKENKLSKSNINRVVTLHVHVMVRILILKVKSQMKGYCSINSQKILGDKLDAKRSIDHQKMYTYQVTFVINTNLNISTLMSTIERKSMLVERRDGGRISWLRLGTCRSSDDHGLGPASVGRVDQAPLH